MTQPDVLNIHGRWFVKGQSTTQPAILQAYPDGTVEVVADNGAVLLSADKQAVTIPSRLGNTARHIYFATGEKFETLENEHVDVWLAQHSGTATTNLIHQLESHWRLVLLSVLILAAFVWACIQYGIPLISKEIADRLPPSVAEQATAHTLSVLDQSYFEHTLLFPAQQQRLEKLFNAKLNQQSQYQLLFRNSELIGANAMALPDGKIIMTDDLVRLAQNDEELLAVLAHEVGHVEYQHGMRGLIQNSMVVFMVMALTGDSSGIAEIFVGLPLLLVESAYSRDFEREADRYAYDFLKAEHITPNHFSAILDRIELSAECMQYQLLETKTHSLYDCKTAAGLSAFEADENAHHEGQSKTTLPNYLASHPSNDERRVLFQ